MLANRKLQYNYEAEKTAPARSAGRAAKGSWRLRLLSFGVIAAVGMMLLAVQSESIVRGGYELVQLKAKAMQIEKENEMLRLEIARLKSPQRIQDIATRQLGMVVPQNVYLASNTVGKPDVQQPVVAKAAAADILKVNRAEASKGR